MQQGQYRSSVSVQGAGAVEVNSKASGPQVLDLALLGQVAGGVSPLGPHGGWSTTPVTDGPHGGWVTTLPTGPHGGW